LRRRYINIISWGGKQAGKEYVYTLVKKPVIPEKKQENNYKE